MVLRGLLCLMSGVRGKKGGEGLRGGLRGWKAGRALGEGVLEVGQIIGSRGCVRGKGVEGGGYQDKSFGGPLPPKRDW